MTFEKILELAQKFGTSETTLRPTFYLHDGSPTGETYPQIDWKFGEEDLIAFAQAIIEAERESSDELISRLRMAMHDIYEVYAGSEGFIPQTCPEAYLQERIKEMAYIAGKHKGTLGHRINGEEE